jgi:hypothetical protein
MHTFIDFAAQPASSAMSTLGHLWVQLDRTEPFWRALCISFNASIAP